MTTDRLAEILYNSIFVISLLNFINLYISPVIVILYTHLYNFRYTPQIIITCLFRNFIYNNITRNDKEIVCYTSSIHASILAFFSLLKLGNVLDIYWYDILIDYSLVYNFFDIYYTLISNSKIKFQMVFHHIAIIIAILYKQYYPIVPNYYYYVSLNYLTEITTVPLNMTWLLYLKQKKDVPAYKILSILTIILYIPFRLMLNTYLFYHQLYYLDSYFKYLQGLMMILNYYWFYKLCRMSN